MKLYIFFIEVSEMEKILVCDGVIVFGVGGVGEPIARIIVNKNTKKLYLINIYILKKI